MNRFFVATITTILISNLAYAADWKIIKTPRGEDIEISVHEALGSAQATILVAPGSSCNSKGPLFETLATEGALQHFNVVRFEWAYCLKDPSNPDPSVGLKNEKEDMQTVLLWIKNHPKLNSNKIVLAGKSQGSAVAYSLFALDSKLHSLALLTPLCTRAGDSNGRPLPAPIQTGERNYPLIKKDTRPILMALGENDSQCRLSSLYGFLSNSKNNISVIVAGGDHGFRLQKANGTLDESRTQKNISAVVTGILNWTDLKTKH